MTDAGPEIRAIVGPTGSGKSALAMRQAQLDERIEIVAIDAFTIYQGMDIGTAKPTAADRQAVRHHMIDVLTPDQPVNVSWFQAAARRAVADVHDRGGVALLVGGSGLYFRAVVDDLSFPPTDAEVRANLEDTWQGRPEQAHAHLTELDPAAAAKIEPENLRRTVRALEVIQLTGRLFSSYADAWDDFDSIYPGLDVTYVCPPTARLREQITTRSRRMVADGLLDEAARLLEDYPAGLSTTARQAIGYSEAFAALTEPDVSADDLADQIARRTWSYARRQRSWFRRDPRCRP